jgi:hypothetical protein
LKCVNYYSHDSTPMCSVLEFFKRTHSKRASFTVTINNTQVNGFCELLVCVQMFKKVAVFMESEDSSTLWSSPYNWIHSGLVQLSSHDLIFLPKAFTLQPSDILHCCSPKWTFPLCLLKCAHLFSLHSWYARHPPIHPNILDRVIPTNVPFVCHEWAPLLVHSRTTSFQHFVFRRSYMPMLVYVRVQSRILT